MMNRLQYLFKCLEEECAEVAQRASKVQRFGIDEVQEGQDKTNLERVIEEFNDLHALMSMIANEFCTGRELQFADLLDEFAISRKHERVNKYWEYSIKVGMAKEAPPIKCPKCGEQSDITILSDVDYHCEHCMNTFSRVHG